MKRQRDTLMALFMASALTSCKATSSDVKNNGPEIQTDVYPGSLLLTITLNLEGGEVEHATCTGSFISPRYFLTAAHCTVDPLTSAKIIDREFTISANKGSSPQIKSKIFTPHPDYPGQSRLKNDVVEWILVSFNPNQDIGLGYSDVSIIDVGKDQETFIPIKIAKSIPQVGERVHIVGFGVQPTTGEPSGVKRAGTNLIYRNERGGLHTQVNEKNAGTADVTVVGGGDSGGALYNDQGEAVGTVSISVFTDNVYVQLQHPKVQAFLKPFLQNNQR